MNGSEKPLPVGQPWSQADAANTALACRPGHKPIRPRHRLVLTLHECGWRNDEIAREVHYTQARVSVILGCQDPRYLAIRDEIRGQITNNTLEVNTKLRLAAPVAAQVMINHLVNPDPKYQMLAAKDILDRAGYAPVRKQLNLGAEVPLDELKKVMGEIDKSNEVVLRRDEWEVRKVG